jgi:hypothetical protein
MKTLVFLLEEPSAEEMLKALLPRLLSAEATVEYIVFGGKSPLENKLERRMHLWQKPDSRFIVMRDQDAGDCKKIKAGLTEKCIRTGKERFLVRIVCRELESFYLGDLAAVEKGLGIKGLHKQQNKSGFRSPDDKIGNPYQELLKLSHGQYQKRSGSRAIAPHLSLDGSNRSRSFNALLDGIRRMTAW